MITTLTLIYRTYRIPLQGLPPLWGRQVPYTMVKFACFERTIEALYRHVVPKPKVRGREGMELVFGL